MQKNVIWGPSCLSHRDGASQRSEESNRPLTPILLKSIVIHLPFLSRYFYKSMPSSWQRVDIHHHFVSRYGSHLYRNTFAEVLGQGSLGHSQRETDRDIYIERERQEQNTDAGKLPKKAFTKITKADIMQKYSQGILFQKIRT